MSDATVLTRYCFVVVVVVVVNACISQLCIESDMWSCTVLGARFCRTGTGAIKKKINERWRIVDGQKERWQRVDGQKERWRRKLYLGRHFRPLTRATRNGDNAHPASFPRPGTCRQRERLACIRMTARTDTARFLSHFRPDENRPSLTVTPVFRGQSDACKSLPSLSYSCCLRACTGRSVGDLDE